MSEDAHNSGNDITVCCIFECMEPSTVCLDDQWFCDQHGKEYLAARHPRCCVDDCEEEGIVIQRKTGNRFCIDHAYAADRRERTEQMDLNVDEHGLSHPDNTADTATPKLIAKLVSPSTPKSLEDLGTRWQHLSDFQDYLANGLQAVTNSLTRYDNKMDVARKKGLETAIELLEVYETVMANYEIKKWDMYRNVLDKCVPSREVLTAIKAEKEHESARRKIEDDRKDKSEESGSR